ncbi:hypothetical protein M405DRAFT_790551 [Rhizopogon salebrosus TDB-379]|nr:hypothetical protein M405DRAFT_790551 [Rhizopogon salebrosus TDB-379]
MEPYDAYKHIRFTPRTTVTWVAIYGLILAIGVIYHLASQTHLGREAKRGGIGTVMIIPRNIQVSHPT